jgi:hypothetical protein
VRIPEGHGRTVSVSVQTLNDFVPYIGVLVVGVVIGFMIGLIVARMMKG